MRSRLIEQVIRRHYPPPIEHRSRAFINMHAQAENAGDALVLRELIHLVSSRLTTDVYLGSWPQSFVRQLDVEENVAVTTHRSGSAPGLIRDILRARLRGWTCYYFLTAGAPHGERTLKQFCSDVVRICWLAILAACGVRVCQVGVSFEDIGPRHARVLRWRSRLLYASVPRDKTSYSYMQRLGVRATGIMPDVTINLFSSPPTPFGDHRDRVAFSFRVDKYPDIKERLSKVVADICETSPANVEFVFVAQVSRDIPFMRELANSASSTWADRVCFVDCHENIDLAFSTYRECHAVLSNRLHALLPGLKEGATPVALLTPGLDPKIVGVFDSIDLTQQVVDIRTASSDEIVKLMGPIAFDGSAVAKDLNQFFDELLS